MADSGLHSESGGLFGLFLEIIRSPVNIALVGVISLLIYKIVKSRQKVVPEPYPKEPEPMRKRDFTVEELKKYDGTGPDGRILVAVNGKVFDVTRRGRQFYGPGAPYSAFGGRDASRGLATFSVVSSKDEYDDLSDLNTMEMDSVREWEMQFKEKYDYVGRLLKPGEEPTNYSDEEEEGSQQESAEKPKDE